MKFKATEALDWQAQGLLIWPHKAEELLFRLTAAFTRYLPR